MTDLFKNKASHMNKCFWWKLKLSWSTGVQAEEIEGDLGSQPFDPPPLLEIAICILQITGVDR